MLHAWGSAPSILRFNVRCPVEGGEELVLRVPLKRTATVRDAVEEVASRAAEVHPGLVVQKLCAADKAVLCPRDTLIDALGEVEGTKPGELLAETAAAPRAPQPSREPGPMLLMIQMPDGKRRRLFTRPSTLGDLKLAIKRQLGPPWLDKMVLRLGCTELRDHVPLKEQFDLRNGMTLRLSVRPPVKPVLDVYVKTLTGRTIVIKPHFQETIECVKERVRAKEGVPTEQQRLIWSGKQLENSLTLLDYGIQDQSTLHLVLRLRGGMLTEESGKVDFGILQGADAAADGGSEPDAEEESDGAEEESDEAEEGSEDESEDSSVQAEEGPAAGGGGKRRRL